MHPDRLMTHSLRESAQGHAVAQIMAAALQAVDPERAVRRYLRREGEQLVVGEQRYDLTRFRRVLVVGAGKAGAPMARAAAEILGDRLSAGLVIVKEGYAAAAPEQATPIALCEAGHPLPDARNVAAAQRLAALLAEAQADDLVLALISGGGSALLTLPSAGLQLDDLRAVSDLLLRCGATINELNTVRKHLTRLGGGQLAALAAPAPLVALILSDVVGSPLEVIASGPTVPDPSTFADAWAVLTRYGLTQQLPPRVRTYLHQGCMGQQPETPKPGDARFAHVQNVIIASNALAAEAAVEAGHRLGFRPLLLTTYLEGEARVVGGVLAAIAREIVAADRPLARPALIVAGGETTVTVRGDGLGGRNQELALGAVRGLHGLPATTLVALATDGGDGPTDAAGAVVTGATAGRARLLGLDPEQFLQRNDAYHFFAALGDLLLPGPTNTNVNDLVLLAIGMPAVG